MQNVGVTEKTSPPCQRDLCHVKMREGQTARDGSCRDMDAAQGEEAKQKNKVRGQRRGNARRPWRDAAGRH